MIAAWNKLSAFTRLLAVIVVVAAIAGSYTRLRLKPQRAELAEAQKVERVLRQDVRKARDRVRRLEEEASLARRWSHFATILESQSTGKSLREIVRTCGTAQGPDVQVEVANFTREDRGVNFARIGVELTVRGNYGALVDLLDELDRAFPPIEIHEASLDRPADAKVASDGDPIVARLKGVIHETD